MTQTIRTVLEVDASKAVAGFRDGERAVAGYERAIKSAGAVDAGGMSRLTGSIRENRSAWDDLSSKALIGGAAVAGGLGLAAKAAIGWESAWAGVSKTVDGTPEQMAELEQGLRGLAKELPATHEELAGVAEAAGQLGVARGDILQFTETAVALGESTNLSADEAATSLAKFSNIMGTVSREGVAGYEKLGSTLVALGNDGASTEADIMSMSLRLAGAGKQIGATESDILAMANALTSVGIEAELGGGAMSRAMLQMNSAVISGGDELDKFAAIAGMSASEFATAWRDDPIQATNAFVAGLGKIGDSGGDASAALDGVGLSGTQNAQVLLRAAGASDLLSDSLSLGEKAWAENAALAEEAGKRYATTESRLKIAKNTMKDAAIDAGSVLGPALAAVAEKAAGVANAFVGLPRPVQQFSTGLAGVAASALLVGGGAVKVIGWSQDMGAAFDTIVNKSTRADGSLSRTGKTVQGMKAWGGYAVGAVAVASALGALAESGYDAPKSIEQTTAALLDLNNASKGDELAGFFDGLGDNAWIGNHVGDIDNLAEAYNRLENPSLDQQFVDWKDNLFPGMSSGAERVQSSFEQMGQSLASMPADEAAAKFELMVEAIGGGEATAQKLLGLMPAYSDSLTGAANDAKLAGDGATQMGGDIDGMGDSAESAQQSVEGLSNEIKGLGSSFLDERQAAREYQVALDAMAASIKENGSAWGNATEAGRANMDALEGIATAARDSAAAVIANGGSVEEANAKLAQGRRGVDQYAASLNLGKGEARQLKDEILRLPPEAEVEFKEKGAGDTKAKADGVKSAVQGIPASKVTQIGESGAAPAMGRVLALDDSITLLNGKTVQVGEDGAQLARGKVVSLDASILGLKGKTVQVEEIGSTESGGRVVAFKNKIYEVPNRTVNVGANVFGLNNVAQLGAQIGALQDRTITVRTATIGATIGAMERGGVRSGGVTKMADGGMVGAGKMRPGIYKTSKAGILMAEDTAADFELYASANPKYKDRSKAILKYGVEYFGGQVDWGDITKMAAGGIRSYRLGQISERKWDQLLAQGWRGRAGDREERIYAPTGWGATPKAKKAWQHDPQYYIDQARFAANRAKAATRTKPKWKHSPQYWIDQARFKENKRKKAAGGAGSGALNKSWAGSAFKRSDGGATKGRTYVAPQMSRSSSIGSGGNSATYVTISDAQFRRLEAANERGSYRGAFAGTAQQRRNELASATTTPRGRTR